MCVKEALESSCIVLQENRAFREANEELQAQLVNTGIAEGRNLLHWEGTSLAAEFEAMSRDEVLNLRLFTLVLDVLKSDKRFFAGHGRVA